MRILFSVPRAGIEPARIAPLVFETNASTDSAIWARLGLQSKQFFFESANFIRFFSGFCADLNEKFFERLEDMKISCIFVALKKNLFFR